MNILSLDIATKTGFAHTSGYSGVWNLATKAGESKSRRLVNLKCQLARIIDLVKVDYVIYEAAFGNPKMMRSVMVIKEYHGIVKLFCEENHLPHSEVAPTVLKKHATGKGNANKKAMVEAAEAKYGRKMVDDNEADGLWLLDYAHNVLFKEEK